jgi:hypothetical protein
MAVTRLVGDSLTAGVVRIRDRLDRVPSLWHYHSWRLARHSPARFGCSVACSPHRLYFSPEQPHAVPHETAEQALSGVRPYNNESGSF